MFSLGLSPFADGILRQCARRLESTSAHQCSVPATSAHQPPARQVINQQMPIDPSDQPQRPPQNKPATTVNSHTTSLHDLDLAKASLEILERLTDGPPMEGAKSLGPGPRRERRRKEASSCPSQIRA